MKGNFRGSVGGYWDENGYDDEAVVMKTLGKRQDASEIENQC